MAVFYYKKGSSVIGPVTGVDLREAAFAGAVLPETPISADQSGPWIMASRVAGFFDQKGNPLPHPAETLQEMAIIGKSTTIVADSQRDQAVQTNYIDFTSPCCSFTMQVPATLEGKKGKCPRCGSVVLITATPTPSPPQPAASPAQPAASPAQPAAFPPQPAASPPPLWTPIAPSAAMQNSSGFAAGSASLELGQPSPKKQFRNESYLTQAATRIHENKKKHAAQKEHKGFVGVKIVAKCVIALVITVGLVVFGIFLVAGFNNMKDWRGEFVEKNMQRQIQKRLNQ